jgi:5-(aminomethyl)-3-furanmethanol phosphate kinase
MLRCEKTALDEQIGPAMWIVKLGGSLAGSADLDRWLDWLVEPGRTARLVVPGGGPFADRVRELQPLLGYDALAAHRMAILGMQQFGLALISRRPALLGVETEADIAALRRTRGGGVWLPWALAGREAGIEASWDITSDSLALWLASRLAAAGCLIVKAARVPAGFLTPEDLAYRGLVDAAFPSYAARFAGRLCVCRCAARPPRLDPFDDLDRTLCVLRC